MSDSIIELSLFRLSRLGGIFAISFINLAVNDFDRSLFRICKDDLNLVIEILFVRVKGE